MNLKYIDSSFYRLAHNQVGQLSITGKAPRVGHAVKVYPAKLAEVKLMHRNRLHDWAWEVREDIKASEAREAWIQKTPLSYHDGATIESGWVWALHLWW